MNSAATPSPCKVYLASAIAKPLLEEVKEGLAKLDKAPKLVGFLANDDPSAQQYADWTAKTCTENGFEFELRRVTKETIEDEILAANTDNSVNGIIVYYPIFPTNTGHDSYIQQLVALDKDVEGLSHRYLFNMYQNIRFLDPGTDTLKSILPCTPLAIVKTLEFLNIYNVRQNYGNRLYGKTITVINRSEVVGRPLAALLANDGAKVYSVDENGFKLFSRGQGIRKTRHHMEDLPDGFEYKDCLPKSDVIISGVPSAKFQVDHSLIPEGCVCINFSFEKNFDSAKVKSAGANFYVPAIGKVTIVVLLRNLLRLVHNQRGGDADPQEEAQVHTNRSPAGPNWQFYNEGKKQEDKDTEKSQPSPDWHRFYRAGQQQKD